MIRLILAVLGAILEILGWVRWSHPPQPLKDLAPVDAIAGIADALRTYPIIGLSPGDGHGDERGPAFVIALIRDSRMTAAATDVVMEGANGRYQAVMDRYVRGESVPDAELRPIWDDTTQQQIPGPVWTGQVPAIYRAVREVNTTLPRDRQICARLGDRPIEWENVHTPAEFHTWLAQRDSYPADRRTSAVGATAIETTLRRLNRGGHLGPSPSVAERRASCASSFRQSPSTLRP